MVESRGADDPEVQRRTRRVRLYSRLELVVLFAVIFDMVMKPGL